MKESLFFNFAGFILEVNFGNVSNILLEKARKKISEEIEQKFNPFLIEKPLKVHFRILFVERRKQFNVLMLNKQDKRDKSVYMRVYEKAGSKITTTYSISVMQFEFIIIQALSEYNLSNNTFIIHGSAVLDNGSAILFLGMSGAGKSTAASLLSQKYTILADDTGIVKKEGREYYFYQSPIVEKVQTIVKLTKRYPIKSVFILKKSKEFKIIKIKNKSVVLNKVLLFNEMNRVLNISTSDDRFNKKYVERLINFVGNFDNFYYLHFAKDSSKLAALVGGYNG